MTLVKFDLFCSLRLQVENDLSLPKAFFPPDVELVVGRAFDGGLDRVTACIIGLPPSRSLKGLRIQGDEIEIVKQEALGFEEINEFIEPVDQKLFQVMALERDPSGFSALNSFRVGDDVEKGLCGMAEQIGQAFAEDPDTQVSGVIKEFELAHVGVFP
jgi:hypothetical protein